MSGGAINTCRKRRVEAQPFLGNCLAALDAVAVVARVDAQQGSLDTPKFRRPAALIGERHGLALDRIDPRHPPDARLVKFNRPARLRADPAQFLEFAGPRDERRAKCLDVDFSAHPRLFQRSRH